MPKELLSATIEYAIQKKWIEAKGKAITIVISAKVGECTAIKDYIQEHKKIHVIQGDENTRLYNDYIRINTIFQNDNSVVLNIESVYAQVTSREVFLTKTGTTFQVEKDKVNLVWSE